MTSSSSCAIVSLSIKSCTRIKWECHYSITWYFYFWWSSHCTSKRKTDLYSTFSLQFCFLFSFISFFSFIHFFFGLTLGSQECIRSTVYFKLNSSDAGEDDDFRAEWDLRVSHTTTRKENYWLQMDLHYQVKPKWISDSLKGGLVAKKYSQMYGLNYVDTFSLVAKMTSVWILVFISSDIPLATSSVEYQECLSQWYSW